jgi:hypothetical protein
MWVPPANTPFFELDYPQKSPQCFASKNRLRIQLRRGAVADRVLRDAKHQRDLLGNLVRRVEEEFIRRDGGISVDREDGVWTVAQVREAPLESAYQLPGISAREHTRQ